MQDSKPAFPSSVSHAPDGAVHLSYDFSDGVGMTMRQYYKAAALTGLCVQEDYAVSMSEPPKFRQITKQAALYAEAMIAEDEEYAKS